MRGLPRLVVQMGDAAGGTVSRRDLKAVGFTDDDIRGWLETGLLIRVHRGEYRVAKSGDRREQDLASMVWRAGPGSRLAGPLVCSLLGLEGFGARTNDHLVVPPGRRVRGVDFRIVRTHVPDEDKALVVGLPAVTTARALIGASAVFSAARIRVAHDDAVFKGLLRRGEFAARAADLGNVYGAAQARRVAAGGALRSESEPERDVFQIFRGRDPRPERQVWVCWRGRWYRLDYAFREVRLALEYDGATHADTRAADADRDLALLSLGIVTIRLTSAMMRDPAETRRRILAVYTERAGFGLEPIPRATPPWATD